MRILHGICGIGYGHSIRQSLIIKKMKERGARIACFCFDKSRDLLSFSNPFSIPFREVSVPWIFSDSNGIQWERCEEVNLRNLPHYNQTVREAFRSVKEMLGGPPDLCISDYEPITAIYAYLNDVPLITIDQQSKFLGYRTEDINGYSRIEERSRLSYFFPYAEKRFAASFYQIEADKDDEFEVTLFPSPVRKEIVEVRKRMLSRRKSPAPNVVLVYFSPYGRTAQSIQNILDIFSKHRHFNFIIYYSFDKEHSNKLKVSENISFKKFASDEFLNYLSIADCLISTAGHTLLTESIYLTLPVFTIPLSTYDQHYCANVITKYEVGVSSPRLTAQLLEHFLSQLNTYKENMANQDFTIISEIPDSMIDHIYTAARAFRIQPEQIASSVNENNSIDTIQKHATGFIGDTLYLPDIDVLLGKSYQAFQPDYTTVVIKPTMRCVCNCDACSSRSSKWWDDAAETLSLTNWIDIISQIKDIGIKTVVISGGEPLLYSHLTPLIQEIRNNGLAAVLNTNGYAMTANKLRELCDAGLNGINFSLDSPKPLIHDYLRKKSESWKRCVKAIQCARIFESQLWFAIRSIMTAYSLMDIPEMIGFANELNVTSLKLSYLECGYLATSLLPNVTMLERFKEFTIPCCIDAIEWYDIPASKKQKCRYVLNSLLFPEEISSLSNYAQGIYWTRRVQAFNCRIPYSLMIIYGDGRVLPCNGAEYVKYALQGNLFTEPLQSILESAALKDFRENRLEYCLYCPMALHVTLPFRESIA